MVNLASEAMANPQPQSGHLADHAATAALYVTNPDRRHPTSDTVNTRKNVPSTDALGAVRSISHSEVSHQTTGGLDLAAAGAAASLAHATYKPVQNWKPGTVPAAGKAAFLAHSGSTRRPVVNGTESMATAAAFPKVQRPDPSYSAAEKVMSETGQDRKVQPPTLNKGAWLAASGAMSGTMRKRSDSAPVDPDILEKRASHAMSAAVKSHRTSQAGGSIPGEFEPMGDKSHTHKDLNKSSATTSAEAEEKLKQERMHASTIAMARQMYTAATRLNGDISSAARANRRASSAGSRRRNSRLGLSTINEPTPSQFSPNLQEQAEILAAKRLASLYDEHEAYRDYYGTNLRPRSRILVADKFIRRSSSVSDTSHFDREHSRAIRSEMHVFQNRVEEVDAQRARDQASLMAAAKRNVELRMHDMDEKISAEKGMPSAAMIRAWENILKERAESEGGSQIEPSRMVTVGGGRFVEREGVHSLAKERLQPTFDDIKEKAEEQRAREIEQRLDDEERKRVADLEREREEDMREEQERVKELTKQEEKAEKARKSERQRQEKEEHHLWKKRSKEPKGKERATDDSPSPVATTTTEPTTEPYPEQRGTAVLGDSQQEGTGLAKAKNEELHRSEEASVTSTKEKEKEEESSSTSTTSSMAKTDAERIMDWLREKRHRTSGDKAPRAEDSIEPRGNEETTKADGRDRGDYSISKPLMGAAGEKSEPAPQTDEQGNGEGPSHATALRSHPITNGDMIGTGASGEQPTDDTTNVVRSTSPQETDNIRQTKSVEESSAKARNRRSKRFSFMGILGRTKSINGNGNVADEPGPTTKTEADRAEDVVPQRPSRPPEPRGDSNVRDSKFVEDL